MDAERRIEELRQRLVYVRDVFGNGDNANVRVLSSRLQDFLERERELSAAETRAEIQRLEELFGVLERKLDTELSPMDKVRIVRHPQRICLHDILEHVYDNYTEIGGREELNVDPSLLIARATMARRHKGRLVDQPVMVIGHEKGHGQEFRNGGSAKPWGNAKALHYMKVAETENIPIHAFIFTPGSYPVEDYPGAAQQIARNIYEMAALTVPVVAVISEGGSGGAEAVGMADRRLMFSHGYYSVISPEGAAAIEGHAHKSGPADAKLVEKCAAQLGITAENNLRAGYVDRIIQEPSLGARTKHFEFYRILRRELIAATNEIVAEVRGLPLFHRLVSRRKEGSVPESVEDIYIRWGLTRRARSRLLNKRHRKFRTMSRHAYVDRRSVAERTSQHWTQFRTELISALRHDVVRRQKRRIAAVAEELGAEIQVIRHTLRRPLQEFRNLRRRSRLRRKLGASVRDSLMRLSRPEEGALRAEEVWSYVSPASHDDRTLTCPRSARRGCLDLWAPELFGEFAGVCMYCGHHFPMEFDWYLHNVFEFDPERAFDEDIVSGNPLHFEGFDLKLEEARSRTGRQSAALSFECDIEGVDAVVYSLNGAFRGGSVGAAEGEKFVRAAERAMRKRYPLIAYIHGTAGIRIQEGTNGVIQMPRCVMAVRQYIEAGGLYIVVYDTNSYAGPVASFLGCSPYQFAIQSSRLGFAGPGVIAETTGMVVPPDYHAAEKALARGYVHGIWDRREMRKNLHRALLTMGGRNLYYR